MIESAERTIGVTQARGAYTQVLGLYQQTPLHEDLLIGFVNNSIDVTGFEIRTRYRMTSEQIIRRSDILNTQGITATTGKRW